jgi:uncharacterized OsmC-like protein
MNTTTHASTTPAHAERRPPRPLNGVDTPGLFATIGAVDQAPQLAAFRFRATNRWVSGTHSRTRFEAFDGAGGTHEHVATYEMDGDHPAVLVGEDRGPTPVEALLHALGTCITAGIGNIAAARGVELRSVECALEGDIDLRGILGLSDEVRNGYSGITARFRIRGDASPEKLRTIVEQARARSAVFDVLTNGVPVNIEIDAA